MSEWCRGVSRRVLGRVAVPPTNVRIVRILRDVALVAFNLSVLNPAKQ